jgi:hypothetical protein
LHSETDKVRENLEQKLKNVKSKYKKKQDELQQEKNLNLKFKELIQKMDKELRNS